MVSPLSVTGSNPFHERVYICPVAAVNRDLPDVGERSERWRL
jgi:hypothetical protein